MVAIPSPQGSGSQPMLNVRLEKLLQVSLKCVFSYQNSQTLMLSLAMPKSSVILHMKDAFFSVISVLLCVSYWDYSERVRPLTAQILGES